MSSNCASVWQHDRPVRKADHPLPELMHVRPQAIAKDIVMGKQKVQKEKKDVRKAKDDLRDDRKHGSAKQVKRSKQELRDEKKDVKKVKK